MRDYSYLAMPRAKTVNHGLESLSDIGSKLWDSIPSHMKLMNLNMSLKLENLIYGHADFAKFIYKILDIFRQQKNKKTCAYTKIHMCLAKSEYQNRFFPVCFALYIYFSLFSYLLESIEFN